MKEMDSVYAIFAISVLLGMVTSRTTTIGARGKIEHTSSISVTLGFLGMLATFALFIWGFCTLNWYWPIAAFVAASIIVAFLVTLKTFVTLFRLSPVLDVATIAGAVYLWADYWPF
jgi:hypothetical protein